MGGVYPAPLLESPFVLIGTYEQMAGMLIECRERFGVSYQTVFDDWADRRWAMPDLAEVIGLLR
jgi:hypothetical protein